MYFNHIPLLFALIYILPLKLPFSQDSLLLPCLFLPNPNLQITQLLQNG